MQSTSGGSIHSEIVIQVQQANTEECETNLKAQSLNLKDAHSEIIARVQNGKKQSEAKGKYTQPWRGLENEQRP